MLLTILLTGCGGDSATSATSEAERLPIAFATTTDHAFAVSTLDIRLLNADGTVDRPFITLGEADFQPEWSPDGRQLLYTRLIERTGELFLVVVNADGTNRRELRLDRGATGGRWSPDGAWIVFLRFGATAQGLAVVRADGAQLHWLTTPEYLSVDFPSWSPSGRVAFQKATGVGAGSIWTVKTDGSDATRLTTGTNDSSPRWSPDGTRLVFREEINPSPGVYGYELAVVNADGSGRRTLTNGANVMHPSWSPDGQWILYTGWSYSATSRCSLYKLPATGGTATEITPDRVYANCVGASWR